MFTCLVVFHKTNEVSLNHARWLVTFIHDIRPFEVFINKISKDFESSNEIMLTLTEWYCYDIKLVRKEEGKSYWEISLCDDDATRENNAHN